MKNPIKTILSHSVSVVVLGLLSSSAQAAIPAQATVNDVLSKWNVVTYQNLTGIGEFEGRAYVGGDITAPNTFQVGFGLNVPSSDVTLAVKGSISPSGSNINLERGSAVVGGSNGRTFGHNGGGTVTVNSSWPTVNSPLNLLSQNSAYWSTLPANSSISVNANNHVSFNAASGPLAVFNVTDTATFEASGPQGFDLNASGTTTLLINVFSEDGNVNWTTGNFFGNFQTDDWKGRVLFNFFNATTVDLHGQFIGYVVAPGADVTANNNIEGGVVAKNLYVGSEVHLPNRNSSDSSWYGDLPDVTTVPEPTPSVFAAAIGLVAFIRSRLGKK